MTIRTYIRLKMAEREINQTVLAEKAGFKNQSNIATLLKSDKGMRTDNLFSLLEALNCELVIRDRDSGEEKTISRD